MFQEKKRVKSRLTWHTHRSRYQLPPQVKKFTRASQVTALKTHSTRSITRDISVALRRAGPSESASEVLSRRYKTPGHPILSKSMRNHTRPLTFLTHGVTYLSECGYDFPTPFSAVCRISELANEGMGVAPAMQSWEIQAGVHTRGTR